MVVMGLDPTCMTMPGICSKRREGNVKGPKRGRWLSIIRYRIMFSKG